MFGEGSSKADLMLVGEQPGDKEDLAGGPFVGPEGRVLDDALAEAGIDRGTAYVTNAVKYFKWKPSPRLDSKVGIHSRPNAAAQALLGRTFKVTRQHGLWVEWPYAPLAARAKAYRGFVDDLRLVADALIVG